MNCKKIRKWLSDSIDKELGEKRQYILRSHLEKCGLCRAYQRSLEEIQEHIEGFEKPGLSPEYWRDFHFRLKTKLISFEPEKRTFRSIAWQWKWAGVVASVIVVIAIGLSLFFSLPRKAAEIYVFSFEDSFEKVYQEIGNNPELANLFNLVILASIEENLGLSPSEINANLYDDPLFWESLTEEEIALLESEIKKEMKS